MKRTTEFYNEDRKMKFILNESAKKDSEGNFIKDSSGEYVWLAKGKYSKYSSVLHKLAVFEQKYNKDFCDIEAIKDENFIADIYAKWFTTIGTTYAKDSYTILRKYILWCRDQDIITPKQCVSHPFYQMWANGWIRSESLADARSVRVKNTKAYGVSHLSHDDVSASCIFPAENDFFRYIETVFEDAENIMVAASLCLLYYEFTTKEVRLIKRKEVDEDSRTVQGVYIGNDVAWRIICEAKHATTYTFPQRYRIITSYYADGPYLIRTNQKKCETDPVTVGFMVQLYSKEQPFIDRLPKESEYKNLLVLPTDVQRLRVFYRILQDEQEHGERYVIDKFNNNEYGTKIIYRDYETMRIKMNALSK